MQEQWALVVVQVALSTAYGMEPVSVDLFPDRASCVERLGSVTTGIKTRAHASPLPAVSGSAHCVLVGKHGKGVHAYFEERLTTPKR